jgi:hypothetical protein
MKTFYVVVEYYIDDFGDKHYHYDHLVSDPSSIKNSDIVWTFKASSMDEASVKFYWEDGLHDYLAELTAN